MAYRCSKFNAYCLLSSRDFWPFPTHLTLTTLKKERKNETKKYGKKERKNETKKYGKKERMKERTKERKKERK